MLDKDWIAECGRNEWAIISGDKKIAVVPEERQAVIDAKAKVFMFDDTHETHTEDWAAALLVARHRLIDIVERADGPFFVVVKRCQVHGHISHPEFIPDTGSGWKVRTERASASSQSPALTPPETPKRKAQQTIITFPPYPVPEQSAAVDQSEEITIDTDTKAIMREFYRELKERHKK